MSEKEFKLFSEGELSDFFKAEKTVISHEINKEPLRKITTGRKKLINSYYNRHSFEPVFIDFNRLVKERYNSPISKNFKSQRSLHNKTQWAFLVFMLPLTGDPILLHYTPTNGIRNWTKKIFIKDNYLGFEKRTYLHSTGEFKEEIDEVLEVLKNETELINNETINYNSSLKKYINKLISQRVQ